MVEVAVSVRRPRVAVLICSNVLGGHEFQAAALVKTLARHADVTVFANLADQRTMFEGPGVTVQVLEHQLLRTGALPRQVVNGIWSRGSLREAVKGHDHILVSAGAVEAGVAAGVALFGLAPLSLYLPFFFDRVPVWGAVPGHVYNALLATCCRLFSRIVTINRIQAKVIQTITGVPTAIVTNEVRQVAKPIVSRPGKLVFVGRLSDQKRVGELMGWLDFAENPFDELLLIGDGPLRPALESQARTLRHLRCTFHGWRDATEQDQLLGDNDVLLINSLLEGEPLSIRESNARGMRVVARDIVGVRGVTRRGMRYRNAAGLQALLARMTRSRLDGAPAKPHRTEGDGRRDVQVARLVASWRQP